MLLSVTGLEETGQPLISVCGSGLFSVSRYVVAEPVD